MRNPSITIKNVIFEFSAPKLATPSISMFSDISDLCEYYKVTITLQFLDSIIETMQERFSPKHLALYSGFNILHPIMMVNASWREDFKTFIKEFSDDFVNICGLDAELHLWSTYWLPYFTCGIHIGYLTSLVVYILVTLLHLWYTYWLPYFTCGIHIGYLTSLVVYILVTLLHLWYTYWFPKVKCNGLNDELLCIAKVSKITARTMFYIIA